MTLRPLSFLALAAFALGCRTTHVGSTPAEPARAAAAAAEAPRAVPSPIAGAAAEPAPPSLRNADMAAEAGRIEDALRLYASAAAESPSDPRPLIGRARVLIATVRIDEAFADADRALALGGGHDARVLRGRVLGLKRRFDEAARDLEAATALDATDAVAWGALAAVQTNRGDDVEAARAFAGAVQAAGKAVAIERYWTQLLSMPPDVAQPQQGLDRCTRGHAAALAGSWAEAQHEYLNGLKHAPRFEWCIAALGETFARNGEAARAEGIYRRLMKTLDPGRSELVADVQGKLAGALLALAKDREAVDAARAALAVRPDRIGLLDVLAQACARAGDLPCARDANARLLALPHVPADVRARAEAPVAAPPDPLTSRSGAKP